MNFVNSSFFHLVETKTGEKTSMPSVDSLKLVSAWCRFYCDTSHKLLELKKILVLELNASERWPESDSFNSGL